MSYPWNKPEDAMAREAFKIHIQQQRMEHRLEQLRNDYARQPSFAYTDDEDAYTTYWSTVKPSTSDYMGDEDAYTTYWAAVKNIR